LVSREGLGEGAIPDILTSIQPVIAHSSRVTINPAAVGELAARLASEEATLPEWDAGLHPVGRDEAETATLVLVLDALNFCFWPLPGSALPRWSVSYQGTRFDGYLALAVALRRAVESGVPLADPKYLTNLDLAQVRDLLAPDPGTQEIPLIEARLANLREVGRALTEHWGGSFMGAIGDAGGSAVTLIEAVLAALPSFQDTATYQGHEIQFHKRAQILIADLHGAFDGQGPGAFDDLDRLTAFADYKVPQILRRFGVLEYHPELARSIAAYELIPPGDEREVEIRAATIWAVELLRRALERRGPPLRAFEIDWLLWHASQSLPPDAEPYHRTLTIYY
jgi:hypothetical protein